MTKNTQPSETFEHFRDNIEEAVSDKMEELLVDLSNDDFHLMLIKMIAALEELDMNGKLDTVLDFDVDMDLLLGKSTYITVQESFIKSFF